MRIATMISSIVTLLLLLSAMICGFWIKAGNATDSSSLSFHANCGVAAVMFCFITIILLLITLCQTKKDR